METITTIYFTYMFISLYFLFVFLLTYIPNRKKIYEAPIPDKTYSLSIVIPCFNAEKDIKKTIENLLESDYKGLKKIIVVDDCSTDNSYKIIKQCAKQFSKVMAVQTPKNTGNAAGAKNYGAQFVKTELIGFTDDDSAPRKNAISKMVGFFNDKKVGAVTSRILVSNRKKILARFQAIEYKIIAFTRKLLGFLDGIYVTNGPLSIYRKSAFDDVKGFDKNNLTEDIEITWHLAKKGYKVCMSVPAKVYTVAPETVKMWYKQRLRWNVGGMQTISKYKKYFLRHGMLGKFILPFFIFSWALGIFGLIVFIYQIATRIIFRYLSATYSIKTQTAIMTMREINLNPNILNFFGLTVFALSIIFTAIAILHSKEKEYKNHGVFGVLGYMVFYLTVYPILLITSIYKYFRGYNTW